MALHTKTKFYTLIVHKHIIVKQYFTQNRFPIAMIYFTSNL